MVEAGDTRAVEAGENQGWIMKKNCVAVFAKTPGLTPLKTRLAKDVGQQKAKEIFVLCVDEVQKSLQEFIAQNPDWDVVWAVAEEVAPENEFWQKRPFKTLWTGDGSLGTRQANIYEDLRAEYESVMLIGTDCPQLSSDILQEASVSQSKATFGPATDGGYYLFKSSEDISREIWESVPYSCAETLEVFAKKLGGDIAKLEPLTDLDEISDIEKILAEAKPFTSVAEIYSALSQLSTSLK